MALLRRFLVTSIGSLGQTAFAVGVTALQEVVLRATLVQRDTWLRARTGRDQLEGAALERQRLVWACSINASMVAELVSIVLAGGMVVLFEPHRFAVNFGYAAEAGALDVGAVLVAVAMQFAAEWPVDVVGLHFESRQGLPVLRHFGRFTTPETVAYYMVSVWIALHIALWAYKTAPNWLMCDADAPCACAAEAGFELYAEAGVCSGN